MFTQTFIPGIPKDEYRIRLNTAEIKIDAELSRLLSDLGLKTKPHDDGYLLIYGRKEDVVAFLGEVRRKVGEELSV